MKFSAEYLLEALSEKKAAGADLSSLIIIAATGCCGGPWDGTLDITGNELVIFGEH